MKTTKQEPTETSKGKASVTSEGILLSSLGKKYLSIIESGKITKGEIISLCSFFNCAKGKSTPEERKLLNSAMANREDGLKLTAEQTKQGIDWLRDQYKTSRCVERKNNPFGYREQAIIEAFDSFELRELYNGGNAYRDYYLPLYVVNGNNTSFEYYMQNGKINIIG